MPPGFKAKTLAAAEQGILNNTITKAVSTRLKLARKCEETASNVAYEHRFYQHVWGCRLAITETRVASRTLFLHSRVYLNIYCLTCRSKRDKKAYDRTTLVV